MHKRALAIIAAASLSFGASGCAALGTLFDLNETNNEVVVCDDAIAPDCAPDRDVIIVDD